MGELAVDCCRQNHGYVHILRDGNGREVLLSLRSAVEHRRRGDAGFRDGLVKAAAAAEVRLFAANIEHGGVFAP